MDVAKVDRDVACVTMVIHLCCKRLSLMFHLFFQTYVASVFHLNVTYVSHISCKCFNCFGRMLQVFHPNVAKVDLVLHMLQWDPSAAATCCSC
jgi:hypothetical protein